MHRGGSVHCHLLSRPLLAAVHAIHGHYTLQAFILSVLRKGHPPCKRMRRSMCSPALPLTLGPASACGGGPRSSSKGASTAAGPATLPLSRTLSSQLPSAYFKHLCLLERGASDVRGRRPNTGGEGDSPPECAAKVCIRRSFHTARCALCRPVYASRKIDDVVAARQAVSARQHTPAAILGGRGGLPLPLATRFRVCLQLRCALLSVSAANYLSTYYGRLWRCA